MSYRFYLLSVSVVLLLTCAVSAQEQSSLSGFGLEANVMGGRVIKHTRKFKAPIPPLSAAVDLNMEWQTYGRNDWEQRRRFPMIGLGMTFTNYGYNSIYGNCLGIYPNIQFPLLRRKGFEWTLRIGDGLAYVTKKYQSISPVDTLNNAIGSNLNDFAVVMTDLRFHLDAHWHLQVGANFTHISNADYHQPNLGVNMGGLHVGVQYYPVTCSPKRIVRELPRLRSRWLIETTAGIGFVESRAPGHAELPTYVGSLYASRRWKSKNKIFFGADIAYHRDTYAFLKWCELYRGFESRHSWDGAVFAGNEFLMGNVGIVAQLGIYYHQTYLKFDPYYEKIGCNYYLVKREQGLVKEVFLSAMLVASEITAQFAVFGVGTGF